MQYHEIVRERVVANYTDFKESATMKHKIRRFGIMLFAIILLSASGAVYAQVPGPGGPYNSGFTVQNLTSTTASCTIQLYDSSGNPDYTNSSVSIPGNGSYFLYVGGLSIDSDQYSVVISCDQEVAAVANHTSSSGTAASYEGMSASEASNVLYAPGFYNNYYGYYSNLVVQNASSSSVSVTVELFAPGNATAEDSVTKSIATPGQAVSFNYDEFTLSGTIYSAKITATGGDVAAVVNVWNASGESYSYTPFSSGSTIAYAPVLMNYYYGFYTALTVQNLGSSSTSVRVTYSNGTVSTKTVAANSSQLWYTPNEISTTGWLGSAKVESLDSQPIVVLVNEKGSTDGRAASYTGFPSGSKTVNAPIVLKNYYGYSTSITCQNVGSGTADITVTYSNGATETKSNVAANGTALFYQPNLSTLPNNFNGSATITSAEDIVCVVNENQVSNSAVQDWLLTYGGIGQ